MLRQGSGCHVSHQEMNFIRQQSPEGWGGVFFAAIQSRWGHHFGFLGVIVCLWIRDLVETSCFSVVSRLELGFFAFRLDICLISSGIVGRRVAHINSARSSCGSLSVITLCVTPHHRDTLPTVKKDRAAHIPYAKPGLGCILSSEMLHV